MNYDMIKYSNDVFFKYLFRDVNDEDCLYLLKLVIDGVLGISSSHFVVKNPEINPQHVHDKSMILDIKVEDENGQQIDIEMQTSHFSTELRQRFQCYGASMLSSQTKEGMNYSNIRSVYQIIFIDDQVKGINKLIDIYKSRNDDNEIEKMNLITRVYIYLPYINTIVKNKGIENLDDLQYAIYIFKNGIDNVIMEIQKKVINIMKEKMDTFQEDEELRDLAIKRALGRMVIEGEKRDEYEKGKKDGVLLMTTQLFSNFYPHESSEFLKDCTLEQLKNIVNFLVKESSLEVIYSYLEK